MQKKIGSTLLSASIICADMLRLRDQVSELVENKIDMIHFDVMDGVFVPRYGLHPEMLSAIRSVTDTPVDVHLMVCDPEPYIQQFCEAGADIITVHVEGNLHLDRTLRLIRKYGSRVGVALNPATSPKEIEWFFEDLDYILVMGINPGIVGHPLCTKIDEKISIVRGMADRASKAVIVAVDGGVSMVSAPQLVARGADCLICGTSTIFKNDRSLGSTVSELRERLAVI